MWFNNSDLILYDTIKIKDLNGYVLPHAGTKYTGKIISHTLRFKPIKKINYILILYYPASIHPDIDNKYYHEYYVPWKSMEYIFNDSLIQFEGFQVKNELEYDIVDKLKNKLKNNNSLIVVSADFSHFLQFQNAINIENKAAHMLLFNKLNNKLLNYIDNAKTFKFLNKIKSNNIGLQWIGRTRSSGEKGVGYLSFLLRKKNYISKKNIDGIFVSVYSNDMIAHECLGEWFSDNKKITKDIINNLIKKVILLGFTESRLTSGMYKNAKLTNFTVTYLYKDKTRDFIRGWHGIKYNAFFLPNVFLENTFDNGSWIKYNDNKWNNKYDNFNINETLHKLNIKSGFLSDKKINNKLYTLYKSKDVQYEIKNFKINRKSNTVNKNNVINNISKLKYIRV